MARINEVTADQDYLDYINRRTIATECSVCKKKFKLGDKITVRKRCWGTCVRYHRECWENLHK